MQRSDGGGVSWHPVGNEFAYDGDPGTHQWYDSASRQWAFTRVWCFAPPLTDRDTVWAGIADAALIGPAPTRTSGSGCVIAAPAGQ